MPIDKQQLRSSIRGAIKAETEGLWPDIQEYMEAETRKLADTLKMIELLYQSGKINQQSATALYRMQENATKAVWITVEGLAVVMAERILSAVNDSIRQTINTALNFQLL